MSASFCLPRPQRRKPTAAILPLINVVFLLLMFIVLAGVIRTPDPFALTPPSAAEGERADAADPDTTLFVSASGEVRFRSLAGEDAIMAEVGRLASAGELQRLTLRADARVSAARIVKLVEALRATGIGAVELQAERRP
jgi:biopolymer transport protein ExbD